MDTEDATQEILTKIVTNLSKFNERSAFRTWSYKPVVNYLLNLKKTKADTVLTSFDAYAEDLSTFKASKDYDLPDNALLEKELKTSCTLAILHA